MHALPLKEKLFFRATKCLNFLFLTAILYSVYYASNYAAFVLYELERRSHKNTWPRRYLLNNLTPVYIIIIIRVLFQYFIFVSRHNLIS